MRPIGVLLNAEYPAAELIRLGRLAEELGYQTLWYVDVRLMRECYVGLASLAMATRRIRLATGVTDPYSRHPALTAAAIASLDELSEGRAVLGLGLGGSGFRELGIEKTLPVAALREGIGIVRGLLRGEEVTVAGKVLSLTGARLQFAPHGAVPIYIATQGAQISRLAGELADGVLIANTLHPPALDLYLAQLAAGAAKAGRALSDIDVNLRWELCIADDEAAAMQVMRRRLAQRIVNGYPNLRFLEALDVRLPQAFLDVAARKDPALIAEAMAALPEEVLARSVLAGNPARVAAGISAMLRPGVTGMTIRPHACPGSSTEDVVRRFAREVVPLLDG